MFHNSWKTKCSLEFLYVELKWVWILKVTATRIKDRDMYDIILYDCWWINSTFMDLFTVPDFFNVTIVSKKREWGHQLKLHMYLCTRKCGLVIFLFSKHFLCFFSIWYKFIRVFIHKLGFDYKKVTYLK